MEKRENDYASACHDWPEKRIVCHASGKWLKQATGGCDRGGISAFIQKDTSQCMASCVGRGQCVNCLAEEMAERIDLINLLPP